VLDGAFLKSLGEGDIVYSWGVLHHTGRLQEALGNVSHLVSNGGYLFIAVYNDQRFASRIWLRTKEAYNRLPHGLRWLVLIPGLVVLWGPASVRDLLQGRPFHTWRNYPRVSLRGMSAWRDVVDWVGGLPFEVATPEYIVDFYRTRGFNLTRIRTCNGHGCNEYVFRRER
jgi:2-polyprenyl-6-hydroxyphenyl methylase/3-demethylubiquinone-9 3-methyltransferase